MKIGWLIETAGIFGSVREIVEISNHLIDFGHDVSIYTKYDKNPGWIPSKAKYKNENLVRTDELDYLILVSIPEEHYFNLWEESKAKSKIYCLMGFPTDALHTESDIFLTAKHDHIVKNYHTIYDGEWQSELVKKYSCNHGPAIGGINLEMFKPMNVLKAYDVVWSGDMRPRKGGDVVLKAIEGLSAANYFSKGHERVPNGISRFLCQGRVYVDGHRRGGWCNPVIEAMASGVPVVCTDVPCASFAIHEKTALVVPVDDHVAMREAINRVLSDKELANELRGNALEYIKRYEYSLIAKRLENELLKRINQDKQ